MKYTILAYRWALTLPGLALFLCSLPAQTADEYRGSRISLFDFRLEGAGEDRMLLHCQAANTGRNKLEFKGKKTANDFILELDSSGLPGLLQGETALVRQALLTEYFKLAPGAVQDHLVLDLGRPADSLLNVVRALSTDSEFCPNLIIDTLWVVQRSEKTVTIQYILANTGNAPALLLGPGAGADDNLALQLYASTSSALPRSAAPLNTVVVQRGQETIGGVLLPGKRLSGKISAASSALSENDRYLVLVVDPGQLLLECSRTDNQRGLLLFSQD